MHAAVFKILTQGFRAAANHAAYYDAKPAAILIHIDLRTIASVRVKAWPILKARKFKVLKLFFIDQGV